VTRVGVPDSRDDPGLAHLRAADPVLARLIGRLDDEGISIVLDPSRGGRYPVVEPFGALARTILGQQVSVGAARSMRARLEARFGGRLPTPEEVIADDPDELRAAAGLSRAKERFIRELAQLVASGEVDLDELTELDDDNVLTRLCAIKGIGPWTAHVFLMFQLRRPDVLAPGDLAIRRAVKIAYGLEAPPTPDELVAMAEPWRPYRSTASRLLWKSLDVVPV
jgi:DNA-3-methyladenine glycosylase II